MTPPQLTVDSHPTSILLRSCYGFDEGTKIVQVRESRRHDPNMELRRPSRSDPDLRLYHGYLVVEHGSAVTTVAGGTYVDIAPDAPIGIARLRRHGSAHTVTSAAPKDHWRTCAESTGSNSTRPRSEVSASLVDGHTRPRLAARRRFCSDLTSDLTPTWFGPCRRSRLVGHCPQLRRWPPWPSISRSLPNWKTFGFESGRSSTRS